MKIVRPIRIDYRQIARQCMYCTKHSTIIRMALISDATLIVATLCPEHAAAEQAARLDNDDFANVPGSGTYLNVKFLQSSDMDKTLREWMTDV